MKLFANSNELSINRETKACLFVQGKTREIAIGRHNVKDGKIKYSPSFTPSQAVELGFAETLQEGKKMQSEFVNRVVKERGW